MLAMEPRMVNKLGINFENIGQSLYEHMYYLVSILRSTPDHTPLTYGCMITKSNGIRLAYLTVSHEGLQGG